MSHLSQGKFPSSPFGVPDEDRLFADFDARRMGNRDSIGLVTIFAAYDRNSMRLRDEIAMLGGPVMVIEDVFVPDAWIAARSDQIACMIFDARHLSAKRAERMPARLRRAAIRPAIVWLDGARSPSPLSPYDPDMAEVVLPVPATGTEIRLAIHRSIESRRIWLVQNGYFEEPAPDIVPRRVRGDP